MVYIYILKHMDAFLNRLTVWNEERNKDLKINRGIIHLADLKDCKRIQLERKWLRRLLAPLFQEVAHREMVIRYLGMGAIYLTPQTKDILERRNRVQYPWRFGQSMPDQNDKKEE
jgi:hypothetical protein